MGKSTLIRLAVAALESDYADQMAADPSLRPVVSMSAPAATNVFDWVEFYRVGLKELGEPIATDHNVRARIGTSNQARDRFARSLELHGTRIVVVDEAGHIRAGVRDSRLDLQLNVFKSLSEQTGVLFIFAGTYELLSMRGLNSQLARRGRDAHFPRYEADGTDFADFRDVVVALLDHLPIEHAPSIAEEIDTLYIRTVGCIGRLKDWFTRALAEALREGRPLDYSHLEREMPDLASLEAAVAEVADAEIYLRETVRQDLEIRQRLGFGLSEDELELIEAAFEADQPEPAPKPRRKGRPGKPRPKRQGREEAA